nr:hypothetical protein L203_03408 [Cryptococcus depauperatus CBS 7841]
MASPLSETLTGPPLAQRTVQTSGPLYGLDSKPSCHGIATDEGNDWFTTTLCALSKVVSSKIQDNIKLDKGTLDKVESAIFSVYGLDGNAKTISVNYKDAGGDGHDNANGAWFAGGFAKAIEQVGGSGVEDGNLFNKVASQDSQKMVDAGKWAFKYLTGKDAVTVEGGNGDPAKKIDPKNAGNSVDEWLGKANDNPVIILTSDKPTAKYLAPNHYYTVYQQNQEDKTLFQSRLALEHHDARYAAVLHPDSSDTPENEYPVHVSLVGLSPLLMRNVGAVGMVL